MELNWYSPIHSPSGYTVACQQFIYYLIKNHSVKLNIEEYGHWDNIMGRRFVFQRDFILSHFKKHKSKLPTLSFIIPELFKNGTGKNIGFTMYEVDGIPPQWVDICNEMDNIFVPSTFNYETFSNSGVEKEKLCVSPLGIDTNTFNPNTKPLNILNKAAFNFLSVFQWTVRKGPKQLLEAYWKAFDPDEDVALILKCYEADDSIGATNVIRNALSHWKHELGYKKTPKVLLFSKLVGHKEIPRVYTAADAFVLPTCGEGWNLPAIEAGASGLPVITTNWSAHKDFLNNSNSYLVPYKLIPADWKSMIHIHGGYKGMNWAECNVNSLARRMRFVYENQEKAKRKARKLRNDLIENWTWEKGAEKFYNNLVEVL